MLESCIQCFPVLISNLTRDLWLCQLVLALYDGLKWSSLSVEFNKINVLEGFYWHVSLCWRFCKHNTSPVPMSGGRRWWWLTPAAQREWWTCMQRWAHLIYCLPGPPGRGQSQNSSMDSWGAGQEVPYRQVISARETMHTSLWLCLQMIGSL